MSSNPQCGNQFFQQVSNLAGANVQNLNADNVKTTNLNVSSTLHLPVQNTGPTGPAVAGQVTLMNYPAGTYNLYVFNGTSWAPAN